ncbi:MAG TPA: c-type cytochrome [Aquabacterium sp.]|nr:c-type cytochrome [Aquabacterium sp.]
MKFLPSLLATLALSVTALTPALAETPQELAQKKACLGCHGIDNKIVGPAYKDVAKKYRGQKGIEAKLVEKVLKGGKGSWGEVPMPANTQVSEAEAKQLVSWILSLK